MKGKLITLLWMAVIFLAGTMPAVSCDFCILSQGISPLDTLKGSGIRVNERLTVLDRAYQGTKDLGNAGAKERYWTTELTAFYGLTEDFTLLVPVPYKRTSTTGEMFMNPDGSLGNDASAAGSMSGIGDVALMGRYVFAKKEDERGTSVLAAVAGVKLPTGKTNGRTADGSEYLDSHLQMGTGSTDLLLGLSWNRSVDRMSFAGNVLGTITSRGNFGGTAHQFGNAMNYDLTAKYRLRPAGYSPRDMQVFGALGVNGEVRQREKQDGVTVENSGGSTTYLSPGVQLVVAPRWVVELSYQRAVLHNLYGTQMGESFKTVAGVTCLF